MLEQSHLMVLLIIILAYTVRGVAGFGSGLIAIPLLSLILPLPLAVALVVILDFLASLSHGIKDRLKIQWPEVIAMIPFSLIGIISGLLVFKNIDSEILKKILGLFILFYAIYSCWTPKTLKAKTFWAAPAGFFAGLVGTIFGTGGPFYVLYLKARNYSKGEFRASFATVFLIDASFRILGYIGTGIVNFDLLQLLALCLPAMILALWIGGNWHSAISIDLFNRLISVLLLISGTVLLL